MKRSTARTMVAGALAVAALAGCDCGETLRTAGPSIEVIASANPDAPRSLFFGKIAVGMQAEAYVDVYNRGSGPLTVTAVTLTPLEHGEEFTLGRLFERDCQNAPRQAEDPMTLLGGTCARFPVRYTPQAKHASHASIRIESNDDLQGSVDVDVTGEGATPAIRACVVRVVPNQAGQLVEELDCSKLAEDPPSVPTLDFGALPDGNELVRTVRVFNDGEVDLVVSEVKVVSDSEDLSLAEGGALPGKVRNGSPIDVQVRFAPTGDGPLEGKLVFQSKVPGADPKYPELELPIKAEAQGPKLCVEPAGGLDFGSVEINKTRTMKLKISNCGFVRYHVTALALSEETTNTQEFSVPPLPQVPFEFAPGDFREFDVTYAPKADVEDLGTFLVATDIPLTQRIPIKGHGAPPECGPNRPTAVITAPQTQVEPLDTVLVNGLRSTAPMGGIKYRWRLASQPTGGTQGIMGTGASVQFWAELAGDYTVELIVSDRYNCDSAPATVVVHAVPRAAIHVQLVWDEAYGDVDLHYLAPGNGSFYTSTDLFWQYKAPYPNAPPQVNWGLNNTGSPDSSSANDPTLDIDELWGHGPENVNHPNPFNGTYKVLVHYYCSRQYSYGSYSNSYGLAHPTIRIYVNGTKVLDRKLSAGFSQRGVWEVASITVNGASITVTPSSLPVRVATSPLDREYQGCTSATN